MEHSVSYRCDPVSGAVVVSVWVTGNYGVVPLDLARAISDAVERTMAVRYPRSKPLTAGPREDPAKPGPQEQHDAHVHGSEEGRRREGQGRGQEAALLTIGARSGGTSTAPDCAP
jgi:hypothetical protein